MIFIESRIIILYFCKSNYQISNQTNSFEMKKTFIILIALAFSLFSRAQDISFDQYFLDEGSLRMDVFQFSMWHCQQFALCV